MNKISRMALGASVATGMVFLAGCHVDMWTQPKVKPYNSSEFFADKQGSRPLLAGTVARKSSDAQLRVGNAFYTGIDPNTKLLVDRLPDSIPLNAETLHRGQERFNIYCSPCHGRLGDGKGMIAQRGFALRKAPGNYHTEKLRKMPLGHFYDVITNGFGVMYSYSSRIEPEDRWKIAAYIRVLQASQNATLNDVPTGKRAELDKPMTEQPLSTPVGGADPGVPTGNGASETGGSAGGAMGGGTGTK